MKKKYIFFSFILVLVVSITCIVSFYNNDNKLDNELAYFIDGVEKHGEFPLKSDDLVMTHAICDNGSATVDNYHWSISINSKGRNKCKVYFKTMSNDITLSDKILIDNPNHNEKRTNFGVTFGNHPNEEGLFVENRKGYTEGDKPVYYYAGSVKNNFVKFGVDSLGKDMWWRIVRINEDSSVRLIYAGHSAIDPDGLILDEQMGLQGTKVFGSTYNVKRDKPYYTGYMYSVDANHGYSIDSTVKSNVDVWYERNINYDKNLTKFISNTAGFCNDRSTNNWSSTKCPDFIFDNYNKVETEFNPSFNCKHKDDLFTPTNTSGLGNQALKYPVGILNVYEAMYAGAKYRVNNDYYLIENSKNNGWWTMTSYRWNGCNDLGGSHTFKTTKNGWITNNHVDELMGNDKFGEYNLPNAIRPVLSLKSCVKWESGDGTSSNPYIVKIDPSCEVLDN